MENDPLAVLVRDMTPEEKEKVREYYEAEQAERSKFKRVDRIPKHLAILWCEWNRKYEGSADLLAYEFGRHFHFEVMKEWNKPTSEEVGKAKAKKKETQRLRYNKYMKGYLRSYRAKKQKQS